MDKILKGLNEQQLKATEYNQGNLLVLAGPGAGKTTVLSRRISYILKKSKNENFKLLALTFTNKAANEMKERVEYLVGKEKKRVFIGTFHSFSHDLIRSYGEYIGISQDFLIYDNPNDYIKILEDGVRKRVEKELMGKVESTILSEKYVDTRIIEESMPQYYNRIQKFKNKLTFYDQFELKKDNSEELKLIVDIYNEELKSLSILDFPDLIFYATKLLKEKKFILKQVQTIYKHILIDEGQDTNKSQFELISTICGDEFNNLFILADEDQLIFEWNDARFEYLTSLVKKYNAATIQLYESYRCPPQVIEVANRLIKNNRNRIGTKAELLPRRNERAKSIEVNCFENQEDEILFVCNTIMKLNKYQDTCVIARNRFLLDNVLKKLEDLSIPCYMPMGKERFSTREVNFIINLMRLVSNENDKVNLYHICEYFGISYEKIVEPVGEKTLLQNFIDFGKEQPDVGQITSILNNFTNKKNEFKKYYMELKQVVAGDAIDEDLLEDFELFEKIYKRYDAEKNFEERSLSDFLNYISFSPKKDLRNKGVALLTCHASKGLEFNHVFLISMNQGIIPDYRAKKGSRALEEERRNCFVSVTRTRENIYISYTRYKNTRFGLRRHEPSQFLEEMGLLP